MNTFIQPFTATTVRELVTRHGSPLYIYDQAHIRERARSLAAQPAGYGMTVRYAVKANPHPDIITLMAQEGLHFDASSSYEAEQLLAQGIPGSKISLSSQQPPHDLDALLGAGVQFVATSLHQLELFAAAGPVNRRVGLRVNPGMGAGHNNRLTTGGLAASFGLWHDYLPRALETAKHHGITIDRLHVHVGTGGDPALWGNIMDAALAVAKQMPDVTTLDIGGGFKIAYTDSDTEADMTRIIAIFHQRLQAFASATGRQLQLEIEPGRWLVAHAGTLLATVVDIVDTGPQGFTFLRLDTGMNDILRPAMYGAQHRIDAYTSSSDTAEYVVVGHNCETSDVLTPAPGDPEAIQTRTLPRVSIGDLVAIADTGAYCASMSAKGYNAFPSAPEVII